MRPRKSSFEIVKDALQLKPEGMTLTSLTHAVVKAGRFTQNKNPTAAVATVIARNSTYFKKIDGRWFVS